jgi:hypothetical protein
MTMKQAINVDYKFINNVLINIFITIQRGRYDIIKSCFTKNTCNYNACSDINKQGYVCAKKNVLAQEWFYLKTHTFHQ